MAKPFKGPSCAEIIDKLLSDGQPHEVQHIATACEPYLINTVRNELNKFCHQGFAVRHVKITYRRPTVGK